MHVFSIVSHISRDPYSFFIKVASRASKPDDTLARAKFRLPSRDLMRSRESYLILSEVKSSPPQAHGSVQ